MKRIGIITIQKCDNFGADLQAYALGAKLRAMGYDAENIDYLFYKNRRHLRSMLEKPVLPISLKNRAKEIISPIINNVKMIRNCRRQIERNRRFDLWFDAHVKIGREYRSVKSLYDNPPQYDVYMVGSDQVWNPRLCSNIRPYFLDFVPKGNRCVSFASSFGVSELSGTVFYWYKQWLKKFSHIGLREKSGERIVKAMALDAKIANVLDPTLLLNSEEWAAVSIQPINKPVGKYLLLYDLIASPEAVSFADRWAHANGWSVLRIGDGAYGPGEFLWLFANANAVVTNSFHGTVFSILNEKPFYTVIPFGMTNSSRIESLVSSLSLTSRTISAEEWASVNIVDQVDFKESKKRLEELRMKSEMFIIEEIGGGGNYAVNCAAFIWKEVA